jgi:hypothetical protein
MNPGYKPNRQDDYTPDPDFQLEYTESLGMINWLSIKTRPDITFATGRLYARIHV